MTDDDNLKECLEGLATSFQLPRAQVTLLRQVAQRLLMTSAPFLRAMRTIAPSWQLQREPDQDHAAIQPSCQARPPCVAHQQAPTVLVVLGRDAAVRLRPRAAGRAGARR